MRRAAVTILGESAQQAHALTEVVLWGPPLVTACLLLRLTSVFGALCVGCDDDSGAAVAVDSAPVADAGVSDAAPAPGTMLLHDYTRSAGFYSQPFPSESRRLAGDLIDVSDFPNPDGVAMTRSLLEVVGRDARGFGTTSAVFFSATAPLDSGRLPDGPHASIRPDASVFLVGSDGVRHPVTVHFEADGGPFGAANLLSLLPVQGFPLDPQALYAAVVTDRVLDATGRPLAPDPSVATLLRADAPPGMSADAARAHRDMLAVAKASAGEAEIVGFTVFRTDVPTGGLWTARSEPPRLEAPPVLVERFDGFCVYEGRMLMADYQSGEPPYLAGGGGWVWTDEDEPRLVLQREAPARLVVTLPRAPMPDGGFPLVVFVRTGGGGDRPLVDRGVRGVAGGEALEPGTGPAREFARVGYAGLSVDGPHGGLRNVTGGDEQFLMFNIANPLAMRDNVRQSALELVALTGVLDEIVVDPGDCAPVDGPARFDPRRVVLMGHSMGATIAPLVLSNAPYRAGILSGAGGSWIENVVHKRSPLEVRPLAETLLRYSGRRLHAHDPVLSLLQWAGEPADPQIYSQPGPHLLMLQGVVDTYILPPIANALSLALRLDLGGEAIDAEDGEFDSVTTLLDLAGAEAVALPVQGNRDLLTRIVVQHRQGPVEDGHEVVFQTEPPKKQYRRFLETLDNPGAPEVPQRDE